MGDAATVMQRCDVLGGISEEPGLLVRPYGSGAMRRVDEIVAGWMRDAGMAVRSDAIGNLIGRYEAREGGRGSLVLAPTSTPCATREGTTDSWASW